MAGPTPGGVGPLEHEGPCQFCGRKVCQYEVVGEPDRSFFEHEHPWCEAYTAIVTAMGHGAARNPKEDDDDSEN